MRRVHLVTSVACVLAIGVIVQAAEAPSAEYVKAMKAVTACVQALSKPGAAEDMDLVKKSAATIKEQMGVVENYWKGKDAEAEKLAAAAVKAGADMDVSTQFSSVEGVQAAMKDLTGTCKTCHDAHREKGADGFMIK